HGVAFEYLTKLSQVVDVDDGPILLVVSLFLFVPARRPVQSTIPFFLAPMPWYPLRLWVSRPHAIDPSSKLLMSKLLAFGRIKIIGCQTIFSARSRCCSKHREHNASSYDCGFHSEILRTSFNDQSANKREWDPLAGRDAAEHTPVIRVDCTWGSSHPYRDSRESGQHLPLHTLGISYPLYARVRDQRKPGMSAIQEHLHSIAVSSLVSSEIHPTSVEWDTSVP